MRSPCRDGGVGECALADDLMPAGNRQLPGDQRRGVGLSILDDLQEIAALVGGRAHHSKTNQSAEAAGALSCRRIS